MARTGWCSASTYSLVYWGLYSFHEFELSGFDIYFPLIKKILKRKVNQLLRNWKEINHRKELVIQRKMGLLRPSYSGWDKNHAGLKVDFSKSFYLAALQILTPSKINPTTQRMAAFPGSTFFVGSPSEHQGCMEQFWFMCFPGNLVLAVRAKREGILLKTSKNQITCQQIKGILSSFIRTPRQHP